MSALTLLILFVIVLGPCHYYVWRRMIRNAALPRHWHLAATGLLVLLAGSLPIAFSRRVRDFLPDFLSVPLVGYMWLALLFYLLLVLLALEIPRFIAMRRILLVSFAAPPPPNVDESRRLFIARGSAIFAGLTAASIVGYGMKTALGPPVLKRIQIPLAKLPSSLNGYRIALVADIHLGHRSSAERTRSLVSAINGMNADLIAVVGDLVDGSVEQLRGQALPLRELSSKDGSFFVTGNHEYYSGVDEWLPEIAALGMRPLRNERLEIRGFDLAGVDDVTGDPDYSSALADRDPAKPVVLLAHQPVAVREAAKYGVDLQLSGHTHGGQMVPFNLFARLQQPVISGLAEIDGTKVYVTNGAGFWGPPVRVGAPPDITLVELRVKG